MRLLVSVVGFVLAWFLFTAILAVSFGSRLDAGWAVAISGLAALALVELIAGQSSRKMKEPLVRLALAYGGFVLCLGLLPLIAWTFVRMGWTESPPDVPPPVLFVISLMPYYLLNFGMWARSQKQIKPLDK